MRYSCDYLTQPAYSTGKCKDSSIVATVKSLIKKSRRERAESGRPKLDDDEEETGRPAKCKLAGSSKEGDAKENDAKEKDRCVESTSREEYQRLCHCDRRPPDEQPTACGWEGSAILNHGSLINFGCLEFTFSVTDFGVDYGYQM